MVKSTNTMDVHGTSVRVTRIDGCDFVCLTDMAKLKSDDASFTINHWMRNRMTIEFLGLWETLYNPNFKPAEFGRFREDCGLNSFTLSPTKWISATSAIGIIAKSGKYGGTYARTDIAFKFAAWLSVEFELYLVREFQRLKAEEQKQIGWNVRRELSKINYRIHTDAIKNNLIPAEVTRAQMNMVYASEADVLNVALFGKTAQEWQRENPDLKGNQRDYASINELICLSNMENINAVMIQDGIAQPQRLKRLNEIAIHQMQVLSDVGGRNLLK